MSLAARPVGIRLAARERRRYPLPQGLARRGSACRAFFSVLEPVRLKYPGEVALVFRHWPLGYHRFAYPSARAAVCASKQGKFEEFYRFMYSKQDSLGLIPFHVVAADIGIADLRSFETCNALPGRVKEIEADIAAARLLNGTGTPTLVINGVVPARFPTTEELEEMAEKGKVGRSSRSADRNNPPGLRIP